MIRGTTPTHTFRLSIETSSIIEVRITYVQLGKTLRFLHKELRL